MLTKIVDKVKEIIAGLSLTNWTYIFLGVLVALFVIGLFITLFGGKINKFRRSAKKIVKQGSYCDCDESLKKVPSELKLLCCNNDSGISDSSVGVSASAMVNTSFATSFASKFATFMLISSIIVGAIAFAMIKYVITKGITDWSNTVPVLIMAAGLFLTLVAAIIMACVKRSADKRLDNLLCTLYNCDCESCNAADEHDSEGVQQEFDLSGLMRAVEPTSIEQSNAINNHIDSAEDFAPTTPDYSAVNEVIEKINRISKEGADKSEIKEVALQLQSERAKPENKDPEIFKRLSDALTTLLTVIEKVKKN